MNTEVIEKLLDLAVKLRQLEVVLPRAMPKYVSSLDELEEIEAQRQAYDVWLAKVETTKDLLLEAGFPRGVWVRCGDYAVGVFKYYTGGHNDSTVLEVAYWSSVIPSPAPSPTPKTFWDRLKRKFS